ncbi:MAG: hypothetical protein JO076_15780 [Verrucomicrobia bacterium]|nr:hypothetical protein [Verrucomicrobiota bacterium]
MENPQSQALIPEPGHMNRQGEHSRLHILNSLDESWKSYLGRVREDPTPHLFSAVAFGFALQALPVLFFVSLILRSVLLLVQPALLFLGVLKLSEKMRSMREEKH